LNLIINTQNPLKEAEGYSDRKDFSIN